MGIEITRSTKAHSVVIILGGETFKDKRHFEHLITKVQRIAPLVGHTGVEDGLGFEDQNGNKTLLIFEQLPEIPETTSKPDERASTRA